MQAMTNLFESIETIAESIQGCCRRGCGDSEKSLRGNHEVSERKLFTSFFPSSIHLHVDLSLVEGRFAIRIAKVGRLQISPQSLNKSHTELCLEVATTVIHS
jgi:hypothetical protein